jgi:hypothetical protein
MKIETEMMDFIANGGSTAQAVLNNTSFQYEIDHWLTLIERCPAGRGVHNLGRFHFPYKMATLQREPFF